MQRPCQRNKRRTKNCPTRNINCLLLRNVHGCILLFSRLLAALLFLLIRAGSVAGARLLPIRTYWSAGAAQAVSPPLMSAVAAPAEEHTLGSYSNWGNHCVEWLFGWVQPNRVACTDVRMLSNILKRAVQKGKKVCRNNRRQLHFDN